MLHALLVLLLFFLPVQTAFSGVALSFGIAGQLENESREESLGKPLVKGANGLGLLLGAEIGSSSFSINYSFSGGVNQTRTQYNFMDTTGVSRSASDTETLMNSSLFNLGARWRFFHTKYLRLFVGGGWTTGYLKLTHDPATFIADNGSENGFKDMETNNLNGYYLETGMEIISNEKNGFKIYASRVNYETGRFTTLSNRRLSMDSTQVGVAYLRYLDPDTVFNGIIDIFFRKKK